MAYIATLCPDVCKNLRLVESYIKPSGRIDHLSISARKVFIFALVEHLVNVKGYCYENNICARHKYVVTDSDIDTVLSNLANEFKLE